MGQFASFYNTQAWRRLSAWRRRTSPLCVMCLQVGDYTPATQADHIVPLSKAWDRRLDPENVQSLCRPCHATYKQQQERTGKVIGNDENGEPLDKAHPWWTR